MKPCEVCGKKGGQLATQLMYGPRGYRRYQACPVCRQNAEQKKKSFQPKPSA